MTLFMNSCLTRWKEQYFKILNASSDLLTNTLISLFSKTPQKQITKCTESWLPKEFCHKLMTIYLMFPKNRFFQLASHISVTLSKVNNSLLMFYCIPTKSYWVIVSSLGPLSTPSLTDTIQPMRLCSVVSWPEYICVTIFVWAIRWRGRLTTSDIVDAIQPMRIWSVVTWAE